MYIPHLYESHLGMEVSHCSQHVVVGVLRHVVDAVVHHMVVGVVHNLIIGIQYVFEVVVIVLSLDMDYYCDLVVPRVLEAIQSGDA